MNYRLAFSFLLSLICLLGCRLNTVLAQQTRMTEEEVNTEKIFIEASREKVLGNYENAAILYKEVLKRDNQNDAAAYELARMYEVLDKDDKALSSIIMAIAIDGKNPWYRMFLADLYDKAGQVKKAAAVYEELSATEPNNSFYLSKWALYLMKDKDYQNALVVYDKVQAITGINEELARKKHAIFLALNEPQKAADVYKELLDFFPYEIKYHHYLAEFYKQNGKEVLATEVYKKILKLDPNDAKAQLALAAGKGNHQENSNNYIEKLKPIFNNPDIEAAAKIKEMMPLIHRMIDNNNWDMGTQLLNLTKLLEKNHPDEVGTYTTAGDILFHLYRKREALDKYQKALALEKGVYGLWEKVLSILAEVEDYTQLKKVTNEALDYFPNHARIYYYQGIAAFHQDQKEQAIRAWKQAMIMSRKNENLQQELHFRLGLCYEAQGNNQKAAAAFDKALSINPDNVNMLINFSRYLVQQGKLNDAKKMAQRSTEIQTDNPEALAAFAWVLYKLKDYTEAKKWYHNAMNNGFANEPTTLERYGDVLFQLGETDAAIEFWRKAQQQGAASPKLYKKIVEKTLLE